MLFRQKWLHLKTGRKSLSTPEVQKVSLMNISVTIPKISTNFVDSILPDAEAVTARVSSGSGNVRITLKDMKDRDYTQMEVAEKISKAVQKRPWHARSYNSSLLSADAGEVCLFNTYSRLPIWKSLQEVLPQFMAKVYENPVFQMADVDLKFSKPEARIRINRDKASVMGSQYSKYRPNAAIRIERPAYGIFLYERKAV